MTLRPSIDDLLGNVVCFAIARGGDNLGAIVSADDLSWRDFVDLLRTPQVDRACSHAAFLALPKDDRDRIKAQAGWIVPGAFKGLRRNGKALVSRTIINVDIDDATPGLLKRIERGEFEHEFVAHITRSSTPDKPRIRIYGPIDSPLSPENYADAAAGFAALFVKDTIDRCGEKPAQPMYLPQVSRDQEYWFHEQTGPRFKPSGKKRLKPERQKPKGAWSYFANIETMREAVRAIPNDEEAEPLKSAVERAKGSRAAWCNIIWSAKGEAGDEAYELMMDWSETWTGGEHDPDHFDETWDSYQPGKIDGAYIYNLAREAGWLDPAIAEKFDVLPAPESKPHPLSIAGMNELYAVVRLGGQTVIAETKPERIDFGSLDAFHKWHANKRVRVKDGDGEKTVAASVLWFASPQRREYAAGVVFDPSGKAPRDALNLWQGWGVKPNPEASCERILAHVRDVICGGREDLFRYNVRYDAHLIQLPWEKPGVARVLRGTEGVGKDSYGRLLERIVGKCHTAHIGDPERLTARFNSAFESALFGWLEEAHFAPDKRQRGLLYHLITSPDMRIERKGLESFAVDSFLRLLMTTNEAFAVPAGADARRFAVMDVADTYKGSSKKARDYWRALHAEIDGDGPGAYLAYLQRQDLSGFDIRAVPNTEALDDQKRHSMAPLERWWERTLESGRLWEEAFDEGAVGKEALYGDYLRSQHAVRWRTAGRLDVLEGVSDHVSGSAIQPPAVRETANASSRSAHPGRMQARFRASHRCQPIGGGPNWLAFP